jgi:hypothetical protein
MGFGDQSIVLGSGRKTTRCRTKSDSGMRQPIIERRSFILRDDV